MGRLIQPIHGVSYGSKYPALRSFHKNGTFTMLSHTACSATYHILNGSLQVNKCFKQSQTAEKGGTHQGRQVGALHMQESVLLWDHTSRRRFAVALHVT